MKNKVDSIVEASDAKQPWQAPSVVALEAEQTHGKAYTPTSEGVTPGRASTGAS